MTTYELMCAANRSMLEGKAIAESEKKDIVRLLLSSVSDRDTVRRFHRGVNAPRDGRIMYPLFYIPPYNGGKKLRLFSGELPKTHILSANHYELEILRLLALWDRDNPRVRLMLEETVKRLDTTCFAHFCKTGECVGAGVGALRFLASVTPRPDGWIRQLLGLLIALHDGGTASGDYSKANLPVFYFYAAISDIAISDIAISDIAISHIAGEKCLCFIEKNKSRLADMLGPSDAEGRVAPPAEDARPEKAADYGAVRRHIVKNALSLLPEYQALRTV